MKEDDDNDIVSNNQNRGLGDFLTIAGIDSIDEPVKKDDKVVNKSEPIVDNTIKTIDGLDDEDEDVIVDDDSKDTSNSNEFTFAPFIEVLLDNDILIKDPDKLDDHYDDSIEGFKDWVEDTIERRVEEYKENLTNSKSKDLLDFLENGGDIDDFIEFNSEPEYTKLDITDINSQKYIIEKYLIERGEDEEYIKEALMEYEDKGVLENKAKNFHTKLIEKQEKEYNNFLKQQEQSKLEYEESIKVQQEEFKNSIFSIDELVGSKLNERDKTSLHKYMTEPVTRDNNGNLMSQYMVDLNKDTKSRFEDAYIRMKGGYPAIEKKAKTEVSKQIASNLSRLKDPNAVNDSDVVDHKTKDKEVFVAGDGKKYTKVHGL